MQLRRWQNNTLYNIEPGDHCSFDSSDKFMENRYKLDWFTPLSPIQGHNVNHGVTPLKYNQTVWFSCLP